MSNNDLDQLRAAAAAAEEIRQLRQQVAELAAVNSDWLAQTNEALSRAEVAEQALAEAKDELAEVTRQTVPTLLHEIGELNKQLATERAKVGELRRVLSAVEWVPTKDGLALCPYCGRNQTWGHRVGCPLHAALATDAGQEGEKGEHQS